MIVKEAIQNIGLATNSARVDLIEQLQQDKGIEDNGVVLRGSMHCDPWGHMENGIAIEDQGVHNSQLEHTLPDDVFQNLLIPMQKSVAQDWK